MASFKSELNSLSEVTLVDSDKVFDEDLKLKEFKGTETLAGATGRHTEEEVRAEIQQVLIDRKIDPLFDRGLLICAQDALDGPLTLEEAVRLIEELEFESLLIDDSPYLEVRAACSNTDDPSIPVDTFRAWFIGLLFTIIGTAVNTLFSARNPSIGISAFVAQIVAYPVGKMFERLPTKSVTIFGRRMSLNPGTPFNQKEHILITIMVNVSFGGATGVYSTDIIFVQQLPRFFNQPLGSNPAYQILLALSTQFIGFSLAGLTRRFLVYPSAMIWPANLATMVLNKTFHTTANPVANGWKISQFRIFLYIFFGYGIYFIFPDIIFTALSTFNWITWLSPQSVKLALISGSITGLGLSPFTTFDWNYLGINPLVNPLSATLNIYAGAVILGLTLIPAVYFTNTFYSAYLPINSNSLFDNTGNYFNVSKILTDDLTRLDLNKYHEYSPPYQSAANSVLFSAFFALYTSTIVTVILYYRAPILEGLKRALRRENGYSGRDRHSQLMSAYEEVPGWWFMIVLVFSLGSGIIANELFHTQLPLWGIAFGVLMALIFMIPIGIILAISNTEITLNVLAEVIGGYALAEKPLAVMIFKAYGFVTTAQALGYASDLKLGHYAKIPPKSLFWSQLVASLVSVFAALAVVNWQILNIPNLCVPENRDKWTCPGYTTFFTSAVQWGAIGPARLYSVGRIYSPLTLGFVAGAVLPFPAYYLAKKYPRNVIWSNFSVPLFISGVLTFSPLNLSYLTPAIPIAFLFQHVIRRRAPDFWVKYTYILSSALTAAVSAFGIIYFFALQFNDLVPDWWGNNIPYEGCDGSACRLLPIPPEGFFGPSQWI